MIRFLTAAFLVLAACGGVTAQTSSQTAPHPDDSSPITRLGDSTTITNCFICGTQCRKDWMPVTIGNHPACVKNDTLFMEPER